MTTDENVVPPPVEAAPKQMLDQRFVNDIITRSAENRSDRRRFLRSAGLAGMGLVAGGALLGVGAGAAGAAPLDEAASGAPSDSAILNFALNLEYLEANFYSFAVNGHAIADSLKSGTGTQGGVTGGSQVSFQTTALKQGFAEIASDELSHVEALRAALGSAAVSQPAIDLQKSFTAAAMAAGLIKAGMTFDPFANEKNLLLGAFIFEDLGVTAYKGAAPLITNKTYLSAAAGILAVEAYHASTIRTRLYDLGMIAPANAIAAAINSLDGPDDLGITVNGMENIVVSDSNAIAFGRTPGQVLNVAYLNPATATSGGFFPNGVNGSLNTSGSGGSSSSMPSGAPATGGGGTSGIQDKDVLIGGGAALAGAAVAAAVVAKRPQTAEAGGSDSGGTPS